MYFLKVLNFYPGLCSNLTIIIVYLRNEFASVAKQFYFTTINHYTIFFCLFFLKKIGINRVSVVITVFIKFTITITMLSIIVFYGYIKFLEDQNFFIYLFIVLTLRPFL